MATQNRLGSRPWGFESLLRHQRGLDVKSESPVANASCASTRAARDPSGPVTPTAKRDPAQPRGTADSGNLGLVSRIYAPVRRARAFLTSGSFPIPSGVEGAPAFLASPEADHVALELPLRHSVPPSPGCRPGVPGSWKSAPRGMCTTRAGPAGEPCPHLHPTRRPRHRRSRRSLAQGAGIEPRVAGETRTGWPAGRPCARGPSTGGRTSPARQGTPT